MSDFIFVFVLYDIGVVQSLCDMVVVMKDGYVVEWGFMCDVFLYLIQDYMKVLFVVILVILGW